MITTRLFTRALRMRSAFGLIVTESLEPVMKGEKPIVCTFSGCEKTFLQNVEMINHLKSHK